jgi:NADH:ubiquinone oxidoreductase subunit K
MGENQTLGGTRQSAPLANEMTYPLTNDEYLTLRDNLEFSKFNNWEAFLLTTLITTIISVVVIFYTADIYVVVVEKGVKLQKVNWSTVLVLAVYSAISLATLLCLIISLYTKKKSKSSLERLDIKIVNHLNNN